MWETENKHIWWLKTIWMLLLLLSGTKKRKEEEGFCSALGYGVLRQGVDQGSLAPCFWLYGWQRGRVQTGFFAAVHLGQLHIRQTGGDFVDKTEIQNHANKADSLFGPAPYQIDFRSITKTFQAIGTVCVCAFVLVI